MRTEETDKQQSTEIVFDVKLIQKLVAEKKVFKKQFEQSSSNFQTDNFTTYYLLSTRFIEQWKRFSGYDPNNVSVTPSSGTPPSPFNLDISSMNSNGIVQLNRGLIRHKDFEVISPDLMAILREHYQGNVIQKRIIRRQSGDKVLQIYQIRFKYFFVSQSIIREIDCGPQHPEIHLEEAELSRYLTIAQLKNAAMKIFENTFKAWEAADARIWKLNNSDIKVYHSMIKERSVTQTPNRYFIEDPKATEFLNQNALIEQLNLLPEDIVMIEVREVEKDWVVREENSDGLCPCCQFYLPLRIRGSNKLTYYCSSNCKQKDEQAIPLPPSQKSSQSK